MAVGNYSSTHLKAEQMVVFQLVKRCVDRQATPKCVEIPDPQTTPKQAQLYGCHNPQTDTVHQLWYSSIKVYATHSISNITHLGTKIIFCRFHRQDKDR